MPKHNIFIRPGENLPEHILKILKEFFKEQDITKLERFGGRIQISLTAPFTDRKQHDSNIIINNEYVSDLKSVENPQEYLKKLTTKQLKEISKILKYPFSSKATRKEMENGLISFLTSKETWKKISNIK